MMKFLLFNKNSLFSSSERTFVAPKTLSIRQKLLILLIGSFVNVSVVKALPSYARQTGMSCTACHHSFPELTSFGREFKLNGYTMTNMKTIEAKDDSAKTTRLNLTNTLPLSVMLMTSITHINKDVTSEQNNSVAFPQQFSMFYSGQVTPHIGTFIQTTYDGSVFELDNTDIRYSNQAHIGTKNLLYGVTLNNNPTAQDLWNTTPAWRFPSASSSTALTPAKSTMIEELGMQVAGLGVYGLFNNLLFGEFSVYRSARVGAPNPSDSSLVIKGIAPYWRLALQHNWSGNYFEIGTFGLASKHYLPEGNLMDNFTDLGFDLQYEHSFPKGAFTLHSSIINESEKRDITSNQHTNINFNSFKIDGNIYLKNGLGATVGYFNTSGKEDLAFESSTHKPDSNGFIFQLEYLPWYNTKFSLQYTTYNKFDGSKLNYDGSRNAADNNTIYLLAWINF